MRFRVIPGTFFAFLAFCILTVLPAGADDVQSQDEISNRVKAARPAEVAFVKDQPILGWRLDGDSIEDLPSFVTDHLGSVDGTGYDASYFEKNRGSIVALQMTDDGPDFYIVGKSTYDGSYSEVSLTEVAEKNRQLVDRLAMVPELQDRFRAEDSGLVGALKTEPVTMTRMSDIGYDVGEEVTIASPWGTQTKPAGQDAFLVHDASSDEYYMVNVDESGLPINYVPAE